MHKQSTRFLHSTLSLTRTWSCGSLTTRLFSFPLLPVSPRSERDPDVSLWSGHWVGVWISCQASLYEHQVGEECTSLFHLVFARPGMTSRVPGAERKQQSSALEAGCHLHEPARQAYILNMGKPFIFTNIILEVQNIYLWNHWLEMYLKYYFRVAGCALCKTHTESYGST